jgi:hypothetical protein
VLKSTLGNITLYWKEALTSAPLITLYFVMQNVKAFTGSSASTTFSPMSAKAALYS